MTLIKGSCLSQKHRNLDEKENSEGGLVFSFGYTGNKCGFGEIREQIVKLSKIFRMFVKKFMSNWSKLYSLADHINALKPWRFMYEDEITGVRDPVKGTIGFISVMGNLGEHYALTVYLGERALGQYLELSENGAGATPEMVLEIPQLMLSFEDREFVEKEDLAIMKENGVAVSGKKSLPIFRSYRPGMVPWLLEESEKESMINYLEQFLEIAIRLESRKPGDQQGSDEEDVFLIRECKKAGDSIKWHDTWQEISVPADTEIYYAIDSGLMDKARAIPIGKNNYQMDFFLTPAQVREKNYRPYFSYMLLIVDERSELVISSDLLNPSEGIDQMLVKIPGLILKALSSGKTLPQAVSAGSPRLIDILSPLMKSLGIKLQYKQGLRSLETAKSAILEYFSKG
jgi:hypothetical protein